MTRAADTANPAGAVAVKQPRAPLPLRVHSFIWFTVLAATAAFGFALREHIAFTQHSVELLCLLAGITAFSYRYPVEFAKKIKIRITPVSIFAAVLLLPLPLAALATGIGVGVGEGLKRASLRQHAFNTAVLMLAALAAGAVLQRLSPHQFVNGPDLASSLVVAIAALVDFAVSALVVGVVASLQLGHNAFAGWWQRRRPMLPQEATLYLLGVFAALIGHEQPWTLLIMVVPAMVVYRSLRDGVALRSQTQEAVEQLADIVDMRDRYTFEHSRRVAELAKTLALRLGLGGETAQQIYMAARVHDVGKIGVRSTTLFKETAMAEDEWEEMRSHAEVGARLISRFPDFATGRDIVLHHHERWDGKGYPNGLAGTAIPLGARVIAVADTFDAMTSNRSYRQALPIEQVFAELERGRGSQFEPRILDAFLEILREQPEYVARTESVTALPRPAATMTPVAAIGA